MSGLSRLGVKAAEQGLFGGEARQFYYEVKPVKCCKERCVCITRGGPWLLRSRSGGNSVSAQRAMQRSAARNAAQRSARRCRCCCCRCRCCMRRHPPMPHAYKHTPTKHTPTR